MAHRYPPHVVGDLRIRETIDMYHPVDQGRLLLYGVDGSHFLIPLPLHVPQRRSDHVAHLIAGLPLHTVMLRRLAPPPLLPPCHPWGDSLSLLARPLWRLSLLPSAVSPPHLASTFASLILMSLISLSIPNHGRVCLRFS